MGIAVMYSSNISSQTSIPLQRDLPFYQTTAIENNPVLKENINLQQYNLLRNDLTYAQLHSPQVSLTGDYLFAPFFFNNGHLISVTSTPEKNAYGYDVGLSNGGLYAALLNVSVPLFTREWIKIYAGQVTNQNQLLQNHSHQIQHELEKNVSDQYISIYQWQQLITYERDIIDMVENRMNIVEALVKKDLLPRSEYILLEIDIKQRQYDIHSFEINVVNAFRELNSTCGLKDTAVYTLKHPDIIKTPDVDRFNYKIKYQLDSTEIVAQQQIFNLKYKPQVSAFGNAGINSSDLAYITHNVGFSAGLHIEIPLYDGGQRKIVEQQNKILTENLNLYKNQTEGLIENNLKALNREIESTKQSFTLIDSQLSSQETLLDIIKDKVVTGQVSVTDYLNALQDYALGKQKKIEAQANVWLLITQYNYLNW